MTTGKEDSRKATTHTNDCITCIRYMYVPLKWGQEQQQVTLPLWQVQLVPPYAEHLKRSARRDVMQ